MRVFTSEPVRGCTAGRGAGFASRGSLAWPGKSCHSTQLRSLICARIRGEADAALTSETGRRACRGGCCPGAGNRTFGSGQRMSSQTAKAGPQRLWVIEPKLMLPRIHAGMLRRTRLLELLDDHDSSSVTVLDAGVGYGKTTLVRSWCIERPEPVIWMTLDPADDDPVRLWMHLATAVDRLGQDLGGRAVAGLRGRGAPGG